VGPAELRTLRADPPDAVVVDLSRLPSQGRDVAIAIRQYRSTRHVPLVLVDGDSEKVARIRALLPDATYANWRTVRAALRHALARPPVAPVVPGSMLAGYAGAPLVKKLGIKPDAVVGLVGAPPGFERLLGRLPRGARVRRQAPGPRDLTLWFVRSRRELTREIRRMVPAATAAGLWILWPKQASRLATDLAQSEVRRAGLAAGLVDFKVCAVDATWSGLRFTRPRAAPPRPRRGL
jgi:CheY-like chemotaxis protein